MAVMRRSILCLEESVDTEAFVDSVVTRRQISFHTVGLPNRLVREYKEKMQWTGYLGAISSCSQGFCTEVCDLKKAMQCIFLCFAIRHIHFLLDFMNNV